MNAGPGKSSGGGGGRRRRRGRRPHNQRGQRPGPGLSRENRDGIYTAPMDHSYRAVLAGGNNGHKGGRQRPGYGTQYPQPEPEPLSAGSENGNSRIFAFIEDLFFMAKIQETARKLNVKVEFVKTDKQGRSQSVRARNRCPRCGRPRAYIRKFQLCRICFRGLAVRGEIPGVTKSSW